MGQTAKRCLNIPFVFASVLRNFHFEKIKRLCEVFLCHFIKPDIYFLIYSVEAIPFHKQLKRELTPLSFPVHSCLQKHREGICPAGAGRACSLQLVFLHV